VGSMAHPGFVSLQPENGRFPIQLLQEGVFLAPCGGGWPILTCGTGPSCDLGTAPGRPVSVGPGRGSGGLSSA